MTSNVGISSPLSFSIQTQNELSSARGTLSQIRAGDLSKCSKESALWSRLKALQEAHAAMQVSEGRGRVYDFSAGANISEMKDVLNNMHKLCHRR